MGSKYNGISNNYKYGNMMIETIHGRLKFVDQRMSTGERERGKGPLSNFFSRIYHDFSLSVVNKVILLAYTVFFITFVWFVYTGIQNPAFLGKNYLGDNLFTAAVEGLLKPYLFVVWPAIMISLSFGIYSGIQVGYIKTKKIDVFSSFFYKKTNEVIDSMPRFLIIFLMIFFVSAEEPYYQLYLLSMIGILFTPVVYFNFKKRVEWLVKERFIDAEFIAGQKSWRIKLIQIFWRNSRILTLSQFFYLYSNIVLTDACLGYLGVRQLRFPSLGGLMAAEMSFFNAKFLPVFVPAVCLSLLIISLNLAGNYFEEKYRKNMGENVQYYSL